METFNFDEYTVIEPVNRFIDLLAAIASRIGDKRRKRTMAQMDQMQIDIGTTKKGRAYHRKKDKKNTPEEQKFLTEAAIYLRISSEMQRDGFSIEAQKLACRKCVEDKGYHLTENHIYIDEAFTAQNEYDRPLKR